MHFEWTVTAGDLIKVAPWGVIFLYLWRQFKRVLAERKLLLAEVRSITQKLDALAGNLEKLGARVAALEEPARRRAR